MCRWILFIKFGKWSTMIFKYSFWIFFSLLLGLPLYFCWYAWWCTCLWVSDLFLYSFIFLFPRLNNPNCFIFYFTDSFLCLFKSFLGISSNFFISAILSSTSSICFLNIYLPLYWYSLFGETSLYFPLVLW